MANQKISELTALTGANVAPTTDQIAIVDTSASATKKITPEQLLIGMGVTASASELNTLDGITASTAELNIMDGVTASTAEINILDGVTSSAAELNILDGATLTTTELNYVDGVTSAIQTQLDSKIDGSGSANHVPFFSDSNTLTSDSHFTYDAVNHVLHTHKLAGDATDGLIIESESGTDIGVLGPANTANVTWYGSHNYNAQTADRIAGFNNSKTLTSLDTATYPSLTELSYVKGVTGDIQTAIDGKQATLVNQTNIKSINGTSLLGSGDLTVTGSNSVTAISSTYTILSGDDVVNCTSGTFTVTLPTAVGISGKQYTVKNSGSGIITIATTGGQTIDGSSTLSLGTQYNTITVQSDGTNWIVLFQRSVNIQTFTSSGTWTKPAGAKIVKIIALGAGGGGGSGRRGAAGTDRYGGAGAGAAALILYEVPASLLGATETITVGAGGTGGAGQTVDDTNGNAGADGGDTTIGSIFRARGGKGGSGGSSSAAAGGGGVGISSLYEENGVGGGSGSNTAGSAGQGSAVFIKPTGGGGGGGKNAANSNGNGNSGGNITQNNASAVLDSGMVNFANTTGGGRNSNGNVTVAIPIYYGMTIGTGGGGADSNNSSPGTAGGNAGGPGAGGGGAHAVTNGTNGGKGGDGGNGWCVIVTYL